MVENEQSWPTGSRESHPAGKQKSFIQEPVPIKTICNVSAAAFDHYWRRPRAYARCSGTGSVTKELKHPPTTMQSGRSAESPGCTLLQKRETRSQIVLTLKVIGN